MNIKLIQIPDFAAEFLAAEIEDIMNHCDVDEETFSFLGQMVDGLINFCHIRLEISDSPDDDEPLEIAFVPE